MTAVQEMVRQDVSLTKALRWCGVTRKRWYYEPRPGRLPQIRTCCI